MYQNFQNLYQKIEFIYGGLCNTYQNSILQQQFINQKILEIKTGWQNIFPLKNIIKHQNDLHIILMGLYLNPSVFYFVKQMNHYCQNLECIICKMKTDLKYFVNLDIRNVHEFTPFQNDVVRNKSKNLEELYKLFINQLKCYYQHNIFLFKKSRKQQCKLCLKCSEKLIYNQHLILKENKKTIEQLFRDSICIQKIKCKTCQQLTSIEISQSFVQIPYIIMIKIEKNRPKIQQILFIKDFQLNLYLVLTQRNNERFVYVKGPSKIWIKIQKNRSKLISLNAALNQRIILLFYMRQQMNKEENKNTKNQLKNKNQNKQINFDFKKKLQQIFKKELLDKPPQAMKMIQKPTYQPIYVFYKSKSIIKYIKLKKIIKLKRILKQKKIQASNKKSQQNITFHQQYQLIKSSQINQLFVRPELQQNLVYFPSKQKDQYDIQYDKGKTKKIKKKKQKKKKIDWDKLAKQLKKKKMFTRK